MPFNNLGSVQFFFYVFGKSILCSPRLHLLKLFIKNTVKLVFLQIAQIHKLQTVFYFKMHFLFNISYYYQCLKSFLKCLIFCKIIFFQDSSINSLKEQHLLKIEIFFNIINVFTVTFDHFNESLLNKSMNFFKNKIPKTFEMVYLQFNL